MAPVPLQLLHLFLADLLWIAFVLLAVELLWPDQGKSGRILSAQDSLRRVTQLS
jgi:hypothetical protein